MLRSPLLAGLVRSLSASLPVPRFHSSRSISTPHLSPCLKTRNNTPNCHHPNRRQYSSTPSPRSAPQPKDPFESFEVPPASSSGPSQHQLHAPAPHPAHTKPARTRPYRVLPASDPRGYSNTRLGLLYFTYKRQIQSLALALAFLASPWSPPFRSIYFHHCLDNFYDNICDGTIRHYIAEHDLDDLWDEAMDDSVPLVGYNLFYRTSTQQSTSPPPQLSPNSGPHQPISPPRPFAIDYPNVQKITLKTAWNALKIRRQLVQHRSNIEALVRTHVRACQGQMSDEDKERFAIPQIAGLFRITGTTMYTNKELRRLIPALSTLRLQTPPTLSTTARDAVLDASHTTLPSELMLCPGLDLYTLLLTLEQLNETLDSLDESTKNAFFCAGRGVVQRNGTTQGVLFYRKAFKKRCFVVLDDLEHDVNNARELCSQAKFYALYLQSMQNQTWRDNLMQSWETQLRDEQAANPEIWSVSLSPSILAHEPLVASNLYYHLSNHTTDPNQFRVDYDRHAFALNHPGDAPPVWDLDALGAFMRHNVPENKWNWIIQADPVLDSARCEVYQQDCLQAEVDGFDPNIVPNLQPLSHSDADLESFVYYSTPYLYSTAELEAISLPQPQELLDPAQFPTLQQVVTKLDQNLPITFCPTLSPPQLHQHIVNNFWFQTRTNILLRNQKLVDNHDMVRLPSPPQQSSFHGRSFIPFLHVGPHVLLPYTIRLNQPVVPDVVQI